MSGINLFGQGLMLTFIGVSFILCFLYLLVITTTKMSILIDKYLPDTNETKETSKINQTINKNIEVAIQKAIWQHLGVKK